MHGKLRSSAGRNRAAQLFLFGIVMCIVPSTVVRASANSTSFCDQGYELYQEDCVDIDECQETPCHELASCQNSEGSFTCSCFPGYYGDGLSCSDTSFAVRTVIIFAAGEQQFSQWWSEARDALARVLASGEMADTPESARIAASVVKSSRPHGDFGEVVTTHALFATEEDAYAAVDKLVQFDKLGSFLSERANSDIAVLRPDVIQWRMETGNVLHLESFTLGLSVDLIQFSPACGRHGCWVVDISYNRPGADTVAIFLPRAEGVALDAGPLTYPASVEATFRPAEFPCSTDRIQQSNGRSATTCCLWDVMEQYRATTEFETWLGSEQSIQDVCDTGSTPAPSSRPKATLIPPGQEFVPGTPSGMNFSTVERIEGLSGNRVGARLKLDDMDLWRQAGMTSYIGLSRRIETFVGVVRLRAATDVLLDAQAEMTSLVLEKQQFFAVVFGAQFETSEVSEDERVATFNAEMRLAPEEACLDKDALREVMQEKLADGASQAASTLVRVEISELLVRRHEGDCPELGDGDGVRAHRPRQHDAAHLRRQESPQQLSLSEGSFLARFVFPEEAEAENQLDVERLQKDLPALISIAPVDTADSIVPPEPTRPGSPPLEPPSEDLDDPSNILPVRDPDADDVEDDKQAEVPMPADSSDESKDGAWFLGGWVGLGVGVVLFGVAVKAARAWKQRQSQKTSVLPLREKGRRSSILSLLGGKRRASTAESVRDGELDDTGMPANRRLSNAEIDDVFRRNSVLLQDAPVVVNPASPSADKSRRSSVASASSRLAPSATAIPPGGRRGSEVSVDAGHGAPPSRRNSSFSLPGKHTVAASLPESSNRRGSIQVVVIAPDSSAGPLHFGEAGLLYPQLKEAEQSVTFRPDRR